MQIVVVGNTHPAVCVKKTRENTLATIEAKWFFRLKYFLNDGDQGYGRGGTPIFTDVFEPLARVALYPTDKDGLGTCFGAA